MARWPVIIALVGYAAAAMLTASFIFDVGEVYNYSGIYKRAFYLLGDDVTTWLTPILMWALLSRRRALAIAVACGILFSGTKISLILLALQFVAIVFIMKGQRRSLVIEFVKPMAMAAAVYLPLLFASPYAISAGNQAAKAIAGGQATVAEYKPPMQASRAGYASCSKRDCLDTQVEQPLRHRAYSAVAGLWMTLQGGFPGPRYPNTPEKFADLMVEANPWGINDTFGITRNEWIKIGTVQTPYLQFGSGYGMLLLGALLAGLATIGILGVRNIVAGERGPFVAFTIFFIVNAVFNQTQPWIGRGPILFVMGLCAAHIFTRYLERRPSPRVRFGA